jgi:hypothetical protein
MSRWPAPAFDKVQVCSGLKFLLTALDGHSYRRQTTMRGDFKPPCGVSAAPVAREENRVQMIKIHTKRVLVVSRVGLFPVPYAAVAR